jgi:hypothetical protein
MSRKGRKARVTAQAAIRHNCKKFHTRKHVNQRDCGREDEDEEEIEEMLEWQCAHSKQ